MLPDFIFMTDTKNIISTMLSLLKQALDTAYYKQPIPSLIDDKINGIIASFVGYDNDQLMLIIKEVSGDNARIFGLFAERMASLAVRENDITRVRQGLLGLLIYSQTVDHRDVLLVLSLLYDATIKTSNDPKDIFEEVGSIFGKADFLKNFLSRSEADKSIDAMGYEESKNGEGFIYKRTW